MGAKRNLNVFCCFPDLYLQRYIFMGRYWREKSNVSVIFLTYKKFLFQFHFVRNLMLCSLFSSCFGSKAATICDDTFLFSCFNPLLNYTRSITRPQKIELFILYVSKKKIIKFRYDSVNLDCNSFHCYQWKINAEFTNTDHWFRFIDIKTIEAA